MNNKIKSDMTLEELVNLKLDSNPISESNSSHSSSNKNFKSSIKQIISDYDNDDIDDYMDDDNEFDDNLYVEQKHDVLPECLKKKLLYNNIYNLFTTIKWTIFIFILYLLMSMKYTIIMINKFMFVTGEYNMMVRGLIFAFIYFIIYTLLKVN